MAIGARDIYTQLLQFFFHLGKQPVTGREAADDKNGLLRNCKNHKHGEMVTNLYRFLSREILVIDCINSFCNGGFEEGRNISPRHS